MRTVAKGSESGRELPGGPDVVLLDDAVFSLYHPVAELATPAGRTLTAIFPRSGKRATFTARRESGAAGGAGRVALSGDITGTLVTDAQGRLERLELPGQGHGRHASRVGPFPKSLPDTDAPRLRRNLKPARRGARIGPRSRPHHKGLRP